MKFRNNLKETGHLTEWFELRIDDLFDSLTRVGSQADMNKFKSSFGGLKSEVGAFEAQIKSVDKLCAELIELENQAHQAQVALNAINPVTSPDKYKAQQAEVFRT